MSNFADIVVKQRRNFPLNIETPTNLVVQGVCVWNRRWLINEKKVGDVGKIGKKSPKFSATHK